MSSNSELHKTEKPVNKSVSELNKKQDPMPVLKTEKPVNKSVSELNKKTRSNADT